MAGKEIRIYGEDESAIKIRPYEHHAKYYETDRWELSIIPTISNGWKRQGWI
nr:hypothetical protein [Roseburia inulinivorans]